MKADPTQDVYFYISGWILIGAFALFLLGIYVLRLPFLQALPPCTFHTLTGFYCPGCGGTRAAYAFFHGHILSALFYHPFVPFVAVFGGWFMVSQTIERISGHRIAVGMHYRNVYVWVTLTIIFGNWIIKNAMLLFAGNALMG